MNQLEPFLRGGGEAGGAHWFVWYRAPGLWTTTFWGQPSPEEVGALVRVYDYAFDPRLNEPFVSLVDCAGIELIAGAAFGVLLDYMRTRKPDFHRLLRRQAVVRPGGLVGTIASGFFGVLSYSLPVQLFTDPRAGLDWLFDGSGEGVARELAQRVDRVRSTPPVVRELRALLDAQPAFDVAQAARSLALSRRTLQRQLDDAGTSFRVERVGARMRRAQRLLLETDEKVTAIAREVGFSSLQHFGRMFRAHSGATPLEWRERHR